MLSREKKKFLFFQSCLLFAKIIPVNFKFLGEFAKMNPANHKFLRFNSQKIVPQLILPQIICTNKVDNQWGETSSYFHTIKQNRICFLW